MASNNIRKIGDNNGGGRDSGRANWSKESLHIFCDLCIQRALKISTKQGLRMSWKRLETEFRRKTNLKYTKGQLKNKWDWMRGRWSLWKVLKGNDEELGWDREKGTLRASEEWWQKKIRENVHFRPFQDEGIEPELEYKMDQLFGSSVVQEDGEVSPALNPAQLVEYEVETKDIPSATLAVNAADDSVGEEDEINGFNIINANGKSQDVGRGHNPTLTPAPQSVPNGRDSGRKRKRVLESATSENSKSAGTDLTAKAAMLVHKLDSTCQTIANRKSGQMILHEPAPTISDSLARILSMSGLTRGCPEFYFGCSMIEDPQKRIILHLLPDDNLRLGWIKFLYEERKSH